MKGLGRSFVIRKISMSVGVTTLEKRVTKTALLLTSFIIISDEDKFLTPILGVLYFLIALRLSVFAWSKKPSLTPLLPSNGHKT
jgi:hypothetical protein